MLVEESLAPINSFLLKACSAAIGVQGGRPGRSRRCVDEPAKGVLLLLDDLSQDLLDSLKLLEEVGATNACRHGARRGAALAAVKGHR